MTQDPNDTPIEDDTDNDDLQEDQDLDINAPIDVQFARYYPNVQFINIRDMIKKELGL